MRLFGKLEELLRLVFRKDSRNITLRPNNSTTYTADRTFDLPPGDASHVIVSETATQTLTNKTIDADNNTITNIEDADIKAGANIARNKLASGTANHVLINDASGVFSSEAQLATSRGGTGVNSTATFPTSGLVLTETNTATGANRVQNKDLDDSNVRIVDASDTSKKIAFDAGGTASTTTTIAAAQTANRTITLPDATTTLVGTDTTQTLTNKTLQQDTIDDYVDFNEETASPSTPPSGKLRVFARNDSKLYLKDSAGNELEVGSGAGGSGGRNYLLEWFDGNKNVGTTGTVAENGNVTTTQWLGSNTSPISNTTTTPLRQTQSFLTNVTSASTGGTSFVQTPRFQIDRADLGKPLTLSFDVSGLGASGEWDVIVIRYNSSGVFQERIPVAGHLSAATLAPSAQIGAGTYTFRGFFLPSSTVDDYYVVRFRRLSGSSSAIRIDSLVVGPQTALVGTPTTDWIDFTPGNFIASPPSTTLFLHSAKYCRNGSNLTARIIYRVNLFNYAASPQAANIITLDRIIPSNLTIDSSVVPFTARHGFGSVCAYLANTGGYTSRGYSLGFIEYESSLGGYNFLLNTKDTGTLDESASRLRWGAFGNPPTASFDHGFLILEFTVPIAEWSSNIQLAERAVEEYVFNTSGITAAGASDTTSFGYGPQGALINAINNTTTTGASATTFRCRFMTPILPTDTITVELTDGFNGWWNSSLSFPHQRQSTARYGIRLAIVNSTDVDVIFGNAGATATGSTFGSAGESWPSTWRWRVRKVSGGAAVGYPVSTRNIIGHQPTSSTDLPPAGYIGQIITPGGLSGVSSITANGQKLGSGTNSEITLPPGFYLLMMKGDAIGSDSTVRCIAVPTLVSGSATFYHTAISEGVKPADSTDIGIFWNLMWPVLVTSQATIEFRSSAVLGGTLSNARIASLIAIRIA